MKVWFLPTGIVVVVLVVIGYFGFSYYVASRLVAPVRDFVEYSPNTVSARNEQVSFKTKDGLNMHAWFFPAASDKVVLTIPGYSADWADSIHAGVLIYRDLLSKGYNVLAVDNRAHGKSEGNVFTFGLAEAGDVVDAVGYLKSRGFKEANIGIMANSTGAVSTLMAIDKLKAVGPIVLDSPVAVYKPVIFNILVKEKGVWPIVLPGVDLMLKYAWKVDLDKLRPVDSLAADKGKDLLILHGGNDVTIPVSESKKLIRVAPPGSKLVIFPKAKHVASYRSEPDLFRKEVLDFFSKEFKE